jgi:HD-GYP domain-containing protein (c-di-GMP phosphodiesterase class II)
MVIETTELTTQREHAPLTFSYRYPRHAVRDGLTFDARQQEAMNLQYAEHIATMPYLPDVERDIDPFISPDNDPNINFGRSTAEITFVLGLVDPITSGHGRTVGEGAVALARKIGLVVPEHHVYYGGWLHDVGKVEHADLLMQPDIVTLSQQGYFFQIEGGRKQLWRPHKGIYIPMLHNNVIFSPEQKKRLHSHPDDGARYTQNVNFPPLVSAIPRQHHGYFTWPVENPTYGSFSDDERTLVGQAANVMDSYASARADRLYKPELSIDESVSAIWDAENRGMIAEGMTDALTAVISETGESFMRHTINVPCV